MCFGDCGDRRWSGKSTLVVTYVVVEKHNGRQESKTRNNGMEPKNVIVWLSLLWLLLVVWFGESCVLLDDTVVCWFDFVYFGWESEQTFYLARSGRRHSMYCMEYYTSTVLSMVRALRT